MTYNTNHHESGYSMIGVLIIFTILSVLGLSIVTLAFASVKTSTNERDFQRAFYIAEAGLTQQMEKTKKEIMDIYSRDNVLTEEDFLKEIKELEENNMLYDKFEKIADVQPTANINIQLLNETKDQFSIESTGKIGDQERTISHTFLVEWQEKFKKEAYELPPLTVFTSGNMTMTNGPVVGNIGTRSTEKNAIKAGQGVLKVQEGNIYVPVIAEAVDNKTCKETPTNKYKSYSVSRPEWENNIPCPTEIEEMWEIPTIPDFPFPDLNDHVPSNISLAGKDSLEMKLKKPGEAFQNITINANRPLTFDVGNEDKSIIVDHLNINNGHIKLKGTGKLTIYVNNKLLMGSGSTINQGGDLNRINIVYKGVEQLTLAGSQKIYGSLYAEQANIYLTGSGGIYGNIFTKGSKLELSGGSNIEAQLILAPHAEVNLSGGGSIHGRIIAKVFNHQSGGKVEFGEPFVLDGPISPHALGGNEEGSGGGTSDELTGNTPIITPTPIREKDK